MTTINLPAALSLQGKRVVVTGAASGIGKATALVLAQLGADLVLVDRAAMDATREEIAGSCTVLQGDLTDDGFIAGLFAGDRVACVGALRRCAGGAALDRGSRLA